MKLLIFFLATSIVNAGILNHVSDFFRVFKLGDRGNNPDAKIAELQQLNDVLRDNVNTLRKMVYYHKKSATDSKMALTIARRDFERKLQEIQQSHDLAIEDIKHQLTAEFETEKASIVRNVVNEFETEKRALVEALQESHRTEVESIREKFTKEMTAEKSAAAESVEILKEKLKAEQSKFSDKAMEAENYRRRQLDAAKDIEELRRALSKGPTQAHQVRINGEVKPIVYDDKSNLQPKVLESVVKTSPMGKKTKESSLQGKSKNETKISRGEQAVKSSPKLKSKQNRR